MMVTDPSEPRVTVIVGMVFTSLPVRRCSIGDPRCSGGLRACCKPLRGGVAAGVVRDALAVLPQRPERSADSCLQLVVHSLWTDLISNRFLDFSARPRPVLGLKHVQHDGAHGSSVPSGVHSRGESRLTSLGPALVADRGGSVNPVELLLLHPKLNERAADLPEIGGQRSNLLLDHVLAIPQVLDGLSQFVTHAPHDTPGWNPLYGAWTFKPHRWHSGALTCKRPTS